MYVFEEPLADVAERLRNGELRPEAYVDGLRDRFDGVEDTVRAFLPEENRWSRLERDIRIREDRNPEPVARPPLYGVPVGVKDIFHVDGFETRAGSSIPPAKLAGPEASAVHTLRDAGALVLGKTITTEFAYFDPGPTRNPHDLDHTPGGSSSGSAAAVAAGLCPLALGSQTIGSVNRPAAYCGIVGVKPSYGRIPIDGVLPVAPSVDHVGYFTLDVAGARLAAGVLYGDWRPWEEPVDRPSIGVVDGDYLEQASNTAREHFTAHAEALDSADFDQQEIDPFPDIESVNRRHRRLVAAETALSHDALYAEYSDQYSAKLSDLILEGLAMDVRDVCRARNGRATLRRAIRDTMDEHNLDMIVSPAAPGPAPAGLDSTGDPIMNLPWTHSGMPTVTVPASMTGDGLPMGLQCTARFGHDEWLLAWCEEIAAAVN